MSKAAQIRELLLRRYPCGEVPYGIQINIANEFGVTRELVRQQMAKLGIGIMARQPAALCIDCSVPVKETAKDGRCFQCRVRANILTLQCDVCGKEFERPLSQQGRTHPDYKRMAVLCSNECRKKWQKTGFAQYMSDLRKAQYWSGPTKPLRHGTYAGYARGCHEECCLQGKRDYDRARYAAKKAANL